MFLRLLFNESVHGCIQGSIHYILLVGGGFGGKESRSMMLVVPAAVAANK